jgi:CHAT domain-containing protein/tetratricopeptide (TPR) repeat protein
MFLFFLAAPIICFASPQLKIQLEEIKELEENDQHEDALDRAEKAIPPKSFKTNNNELSELFKVLIRLSDYLGNNAKTIKYAERLIQFDKSKEAQFLGHYYLGFAFLNFNKIDHAIKSLKRTLEIDSVKSEMLADIHFNLGMIYWDHNLTNDPRVYFNKAISILETSNIQNVILVDSYFNLAVLEEELKEYLNARSLLNKCLDNSAVIEEDIPFLIEIFDFLASCNTKLNEHADASNYYLKVVELTSEENGKNDPDLATRYFNLAYSKALEGDYSQALFYINHAIKIEESMLEQDFDLYVLSLCNKANYLQELQRPHESISVLKDAIKIGNKKKVKLETLAGCHQNISNSFHFLDRFTESKFHILKAIDLFKRCHGENSPLIPYASLGLVLGDLSEVDLSEYYHTKALEISEENHGENSLEYAKDLFYLAIIKLESNKHKEGTSDLKKVIKIRSKILGTNHIDLVMPLRNLAIAYDQIGEWRLRHKSLSRILELYDHNNIKAHPDLSYVYDFMAADQLEKDKIKALDFAKKANQDFSIYLKNSFKNLNQSEMLELLLRQYSERTPYDMLALVEEPRSVFKASVSFKGLILEYITRKDRSVNDFDFLDLDVEDFKKKILPHQILIDYIQFEDFYTSEDSITQYGVSLCFVKDNEIQNKWIKLGSSSPIDGAIARIKNGSFTLIRKDDLELLYEKLFLPFKHHISTSTKTLIISPDSDLNFVPFVSLISEKGRFLCEDYEILNISTGRDLLFDPGKSPDSNKTIEILANPSFDKSNINDANIAQLQTRSLRNFRDMNLDALPGSEEEAFKLSALSQSEGLTSKVRLNSDASESKLRAIKSPTILHLATHGWFISNDDNRLEKPSMNFFRESKNRIASNPMHRSGLALAGAKSTLKLWEEGKFVDPANDGILTAEEASQLDLHDTWLTVLSACDTGSGVARAGEGVLGLRRAFAMAGTQNLLLTLWPVDDSFTKDFMVSFYKEALKTGNAPKAMAKVQREWLVKLREERSISQAVKLAGPFVLTFRGNPELN